MAHSPPPALSLPCWTAAHMVISCQTRVLSSLEITGGGVGGPKTWGSRFRGPVSWEET